MKASAVCVYWSLAIMDLFFVQILVEAVQSQGTLEWWRNLTRVFVIVWINSFSHITSVSVNISSEEVLGCRVVNTSPHVLRTDWQIFIHTNLFCCSSIFVECWKIYKDENHENWKCLGCISPQNPNNFFLMWNYIIICKTMTVFCHYFCESLEWSEN